MFCIVIHGGGSIDDDGPFGDLDTRGVLAMEMRTPIEVEVREWTALRPVEEVEATQAGTGAESSPAIAIPLVAEPSHRQIGIYNCIYNCVERIVKNGSARRTEQNETEPNGTGQEAKHKQTAPAPHIYRNEYVWMPQLQRDERCGDHRHWLAWTAAAQQRGERCER